MLVALEIAGMVELGVMSAPVLGVIWTAACGRRARRNGDTLHVRGGDHDCGVVVSRGAADLAGAG